MGDNTSRKTFKTRRVAPKPAPINNPTEPDLAQKFDRDMADQREATYVDPYELMDEQFGN